MRSTCLRLKFHCVLILLFSASFAFGQEPAARVRIIAPVDESLLVTLHGNTHPLARPQFDQGAVPADLPARRMMLLLSRAPEQQAALDELLEQQQTPGSPNYRHWLTSAEFGQMFGPADRSAKPRFWNTPETRSVGWVPLCIPGESYCAGARMATGGR